MSNKDGNRFIKYMFFVYLKKRSSETYRFIKEYNNLLVLRIDYEWSRSIED